MDYSFTKSHPVEFVEHRNVSFFLFDLLSTLKIEPPFKILEVGCSTGALSKIFLEHAAETKLPQKIEYVGVDPVAKYEKLTIANHTLELITQDFLEFSAPPASFSVILFTFSLHHLDMPKALEKAKGLLDPNGLLFVDDFEREKIGPENGSWIFDILDILKAGGLYQEVKYSGHHHHHSPQESHDSHGSPHHHHGHKEHEHKPIEHQEENVGEPWRKFEVSSLPKSDTIIDEIKKHFTITTETHGGPQFFKFACKGLEKSARGALIAEEILKKENERIKKGLLYSVGFRVVARK